MMIPALPAVLWLLAAGFLILLLLVVFGYHLYQRSRLAALAAEAGGIGQLAARKEQLAADIAEMRQWIAAQKGELQSLEAERHAQELARAELAQIQETVANRKKEGETSLRQAADLDVVVIKKRNLLSRLEAEVRDLKAQKAELGPLEKSAAELRSELERGRIQLALLGEQELKTATLQQQAYALEREISELQKTLSPLRNEKERLHLFIEQARHASSVKNERILEQNEQIRNLEIASSELRKQIAEMEASLARLAAEHDAATERARQIQAENSQAGAGLESRMNELRAQVASLVEEAGLEKNRLEAAISRREEVAAEITRLEARKALFELENGPAVRAYVRAGSKKRQAARGSRGGRGRIPKAAPQKTAVIFCESAGRKQHD